MGYYRYDEEDDLSTQKAQSRSKSGNPTRYGSPQYGGNPYIDPYGGPYAPPPPKLPPSNKMYGAIILGLVLVIGILGGAFLVRSLQGTSSLQTPTATVAPTATVPVGSTQPPPVSTQAPSNVTCGGRQQTGGGNTATFSFTVDNGCVAVITGVNVSGIPNSWSDGGGGIEGLPPGSYTVTILDGSYQIATTAGGQAVWCNILKWEQTNGKADSHNYPINGWSSNC